MIDFEFERKAFEELSYKNGVRNFTKDEMDDGYCSAELDYNWHIWIKSAESKQAKIESLKAQLAKVESGDYVIVPKSPTNKMIGNAQGCGENFLFHYQVRGVWDSMIETAQEQNND